jgi:hypothetical protein
VNFLEVHNDNTYFFFYIKGLNLFCLTALFVPSVSDLTFGNEMLFALFHIPKYRKIWKTGVSHWYINRYISFNFFVLFIQNADCYHYVLLHCSVYQKTEFRILYEIFGQSRFFKEKWETEMKVSTHTSKEVLVLMVLVR